VGRSRIQGQGWYEENKGSEKASNKEEENQTNGRVTVVMADGKLTLQAQSASCETTSPATV